MTGLSVVLIGFLLGMKHAIEADHLAAVATLVTRQSSMLHTLRLGAVWGLGHTITLMAFGGLVFALGQSISETWEQALETAVGIMLILLGADVLRRLVRERIHFHVHSHGPQTAHVHAHSHRDETSPHEKSRHDHSHAPRRWPLRPLAVGMMHGLAGSAALVLLSLQASPSIALGLGYIALFGVGSILGMALLSVAIAAPLRLSARYLTRMHYGMTALVGLFSCALGVFIVADVGYLKSLLFV
jgi:ABC-type nickel/cobalt efflux system permease component RcnA